MATAERADNQRSPSQRLRFSQQLRRNPELLCLAHSYLERSQELLRLDHLPDSEQQRQRELIRAKTLLAVKIEEEILRRGGSKQLTNKIWELAEHRVAKEFAEKEEQKPLH